MKQSDGLKKIEKLLVIWAVLAVAAYFVQKATANYTFDYGFLLEPKYEERCKGALELLPPGEKIEYLTDPPGVFDRALYEQRRRWASYLLTPFLNIGRYVISDFHRPTDLNQTAKDQQLILLRDFGNGVALFKRKASR